MLKKINRLGPVSLKNPRRISVYYFSLSSARNNLDTSRFAFIVSKKLDNRAVVRNSVKRKVRSCIEEIFDKIETGWDFVIHPKSKAIEADRASILKEIKSVFQKQGFIND